MNTPHLITTILLSLILGTNAWNYKDAKKWGNKYKKCKGRHQSPILLNPAGSPPFSNFKKTIRLTDFNKLPDKLTIKNTGRTVEMKAEWTGEAPKCYGGPLDGKYVFEKVTFHWAQKKWIAFEASPNAEQDRMTYDMEMKMFFYKEHLKSFEKAESKKGGLVVFSMGLTVFREGYGIAEPLFDNLEKKINKVRSPNSTAEITPFRFASIFDKPSRMLPFYYYEGSLDYPPCSESVSWFIMDSNTGIADSLIRKVRTIKLAEEDKSNVRPPQPLNKREVHFVCNYEGHEDWEKQFDSKPSQANADASFKNLPADGRD
ncbi:putative carbonic anhydrase 3 [Belonocnema kinseyi]|uniref:putative carbonic anhydrase 3 n=1 Tax=Belonocnema kinseyi TaxID=2817044 RepID=UPI00143D9E03|nr:putative carbonic anhydrase 3 [Belonocnema kinseyi]